jgi:hypothetical protein
MSVIKLQNDQFIGNKIENKKVKMDEVCYKKCDTHFGKREKVGEEELFLMGRC